MQLSVVIAAHNKIEQLKRVLPSILGQGVECEMVIVDDGSRDGTHTWIDTLNIPHLKLIRISTHGWRNPAYAKNLGVACAEGEIVLVQDGEILHESPSNLERVLSHFQSWDEPDVPLYVKPLSLWHEQRGFDPCFQETYVKVGIFTAMYRADYIWLGGFNEEYTQWGNEDIEFIVRVGFAGFKAIQDSEIRVRHLEHETCPNSEGNSTRHVEECGMAANYIEQLKQGKASPFIKWRY